MTRKKNALLIEYFRVIPCASVAKQGFLNNTLE